jgi:hypothetical protein
MKKAVFCVLIGFASCGFVFSQDFVSFGPAFGIDANKINNMDYTVMGVGINLNVFQFWDSNIGLYENVNFGLPLSFTIEGNEVDVEGAMTLDATLGPGVNIPFSDEMDLKIGLGFHLSANRLESASMIIGIGVGTTVGLNYMFNDVLYIDIGLSAACDFYGMDIGSSSDIEYFSFDARPYIALGFKRDR